MSEHLVVCMMTSQIEKPWFPYDIKIEDLEHANLPKPTLIRLGKIVTIDSKLVLKKLGSLHTSDKKNVKKNLKKLFEPIF